jgi:large subunit ribosomal protein L24
MITPTKLRAGDEVIVVAGKDLGKKGTLRKILKSKNKGIVTGINMVKKHTKPNPAKGDQGGVVSKEMPLNISNIAIFNSVTQKADKVAIKSLKDGKKIRIYKSNQEAIDV